MPTTHHDGFYDLGQALAGGPAPANGVTPYMQGQTKAANLQRLLAQAKVARLKAEAQASILAKLDAANPENHEQNALTAAMMVGGMGSQFAGAQRGYGQEQRNDELTLATQLAGQPEPDIDAVNLHAALAGNKLLTPSHVDVEPQAEARIGSMQAQMGQRSAAADAATASADARRATIPLTEARTETEHHRQSNLDARTQAALHPKPRGGKRDKPEAAPAPAATTGENPKQAALRHAREAVRRGADRATVAKRLADMGYTEIADLFAKEHD